MDVPLALDQLLAEVESLSPERISALARGFSAAEASSLRSSRRAVARHLAMTPDSPGVIDLLAGQLALSEAMLAWESVYGLDPDTVYGARAAVLDMGLVMCADSMAVHGAEALAGPWLAALR